MTAGGADRRDVLLGVFAHPDDESLAAGGLLALAAGAGATVAVVCLTRGEAAGGTDADAAARDQLAATRTCELAEATRALGVADVTVFDHEDGILPWIAPDRLDADIRAAIVRTAATVVVTFGPDGYYWHPDHIAVCERTTAVVRSLAPDPPALYYVTAPPGQMRAVAEGAERRGQPSWIVRGLADPDAFGAEADPPTLVVQAGPQVVRKLAALACHRSQVAGGALDGVSDPATAAAIGTEHYRHANPDDAAPGFIERFGTGRPHARAVD
jgi:LmbE family N-acetylglucosaminyl deacetylase